MDQAEALGRHRGGADAEDREDREGEPQRQRDGCRGFGDLFAELPVFLGLGFFPVDVGLRPRSAVAPARARRGQRGFAGRLLAGEEPVETVGQRQGDVDADVDAQDGGDQVGDGRHAEDGFLVAGVGAR